MAVSVPEETSPTDRTAQRSPRPRLLPPDLSSLPEVRAVESLPPSSQAVVEAFAQGAEVLVYAAPGMGRTTLALAAAAHAESDGPVMVLSPRRAQALRLQEGVAAQGHQKIRVLTPPALGYALLREQSLRDGGGEPSLVTGADQDALLKDLIAERQRWHLEVESTARELPEFRAELRDLITRAEELGVSPEALLSLAEQRDRPAWADGAELMRDYLGVLDLQSGAALDAGPRLDAGALVGRAADLLDSLRTDDQGLPLPRTLIVDDAQDLTAAGIALVLALARHGVRLFITSCADAAVDTFRGGIPEAAVRLREAAPRPLQDMVLLERPPGMSPAVVAAVDALRARLPLAGAPSLTRRPALSAPAEMPTSTDEPEGNDNAGASEGKGVDVLIAGDDLEEAHAIAAVLRDVHHREAVPYDDMAVICRSGAVVQQVADQLSRAGLPVRTPQRLGPLRDEPVVADLLTIIELAVAAGPDPIDEERADQLLEPCTAQRLLSGPYGDADALRLRRVRRALLAAQRGDDAKESADHTPAHEAAHGSHAEQDPSPDDQPEGDQGDSDLSGRAATPLGGISSERLLARALLLDDVPGLLGPQERDRYTAPIHRIRDMIAAARTQVKAGALDTLWAAWDAARLATGWQIAALGTPDDSDDSRARLLTRRLDALVALFAVAERFVERRPDADAAQFAAAIRAQAVVEDTLAPSAAVRGRVDVLTPAQIAGTHRDTVVIARVQEGSWPDLRLRSTLFGAAELPLVLNLPADEAAHAGSVEQLRAIQRTTVANDELRLAVSALARARSRVLITAVDGQEQSPSALVDVLSTHVRSTGGWVDRDALRADPGPAPDARRLVAALRRDLRAEDEERAQHAAAMLLHLESAGAEGTDPDRWYHQLPTCDAPLFEPEHTVALSPSALESAHQCPQAWLFSRAGGRRAGAAAPTIGTCLHALAEENPTGGKNGPEDLVALMHQRLAPLRLEASWSGRRLLRRTEEATRVLDAYLRSHSEPLACEARFDVQLGRVTLRGTIDRIEGDAKGLRVADLKTGASAKSKDDALVDLQMAAYQTAVREGALNERLGEDAPERLNGAALIYVGTGTAKASERIQPALHRSEDPEWFSTLVAQVAEDLSSPALEARADKHCRTCPVRSSCTLVPEGEQL